jgi:prepilin-type processing-associated H-X9-DG protein
MQTGRTLSFERFHIPIAVEAGYYTVECAANTGNPLQRRILRQGFWGMDRALLQEGEPLTVGRDYFLKNGQPLPIVGMTYMTSDVARKYLFLPNSAVWDRDMAQMKKAGINLIRTGIWTAWRNMMFVDGHASEEVLRAIDSFFLTAKKHDLEVTFNFFSFTPETWEGANPYLDPRSVEAQRRFIASVVWRHRDSKHVHWDLINEPSMFDPKRIFSGPRTANDRYERAAYIDWLKARHGGSIRLLQERWPRKVSSGLTTRSLRWICTTVGRDSSWRRSRRLRLSSL